MKKDYERGEGKKNFKAKNKTKKWIYVGGGKRMETNEIKAEEKNEIKKGVGGWLLVFILTYYDNQSNYNNC